jgi:4-hydroxybenzoyl-CoA reductase subunit beta
MMRLPYFEFYSPRDVSEAADLLASAPPGHTMIVAGGTDLLPNMKRRQQMPKALVSLRRVEALRAIANGNGLDIGAGVTLARLVRDARVRASYAALWQAVRQIATPHLRNMGTIGGNLCLDTRCNYYDQNYEWRKAIDFCMKKDGEICWVATSSPRCLAVSSTDAAPALIALGADVTLASTGGRRRIALGDLYRNDGIHYLTRRPDEILTTVHLPAADGWRSSYWKLRRRGSFDFPVLSVAAAVKRGSHGVVEDARIVLGAIASRPLEVPAAGRTLVGRALDDDAIAHAAKVAAQPARPMDNTDFSLLWRKRVTRDFVSYALRDVRGDDMRELRRKITRFELV